MKVQETKNRLIGDIPKLERPVITDEAVVSRESWGSDR